MKTARRAWNRRQFLGAAATVAAFGSVPWVWAAGSDAPRKRKTILSFYCDDTGPYVAGVKAFQTFLDYCAAQGIAGESSVILGASGQSMARQPRDGQHGVYDLMPNARDFFGIWENDPKKVNPDYYITADGGF